MADQITAAQDWLAEVRREVTGYSLPKWSATPRLLAALDAVLALHVPKAVTVRHLCRRHGGMGWPGKPASREQVDACPDCTTTGVITCAKCNPVCPDDNEWPCPEYLAISRALLGEDTTS